jgi:cell division protein FtsN
MRQSSGNRSSGNGGGSKLMLGIFVGLVVGVLGAFGVVLYLNKATLPFQDKSGRPEHDESAAAARAALPLPGKPGDKPVEKPRFEFYKILPGTQEASPNTAPPPAPPPADGQPAVAADQFYLQVGAFQKPADADNVKAKLALIGIDSSVQDVNLADKGTLHRVRTGPYATPAEMNAARTLMAQNGVQSTPIKIKDSGNQTPPAESKQGKQ